MAELVSYIKDYVKVRRFGGITPDWICKEKIQPDVNAFLDCRINSILERERKKREKEENATERKR
ncbi:MAG: hypothetical protein FWD92_00055 [Methanomassiliicoccaceae archaeon]|nr:hypothetical protein [Methanomassiliicoccaceae archaeon]